MAIDPGPQLTARNLVLTPIGLLALALLAVELLAGIQTYLTSTVTPLMARDLAAQEFYGVLAASTQAALFLTMPLGAALLARWPAATLLTWLTPVVIGGGVISAAAPGIWSFTAGRVVAALAAGALMTVSLGALVTVLPPAWRRMVLAGYAGVWVVSSLVGPAYAAWVAQALGWRWALVAYLPLLVAVRVVVIRRLRELEPPRQRRRPPLGLGPALGLAAGIALVSATGAGAGPVRWLGLAGAVVVLAAAARILPTGVLRAAPGRPAAVLSMAVLCAAYFGAAAVVTITAHDVMGRGAADLGILLSAGGLGWAVVGLLCGRWPAPTRPSYRRRVALSSLTMAAGLGLVAVSVGLSASPAGWPMLVGGWGLAGVGMGLCYVDTLNVVFDTPVEADGIDGPEAAGAVVMAEVIGTALAATLTASAVAWLLVSAASPVGGVAAVFAGLGVLALGLLPLRSRV